VIVVALLAFACGGGASSDGVIELKFGHVGGPGSLYDLAANEFARRVDERLDGRVQVTVFGASQLGSDEILLQKLKLGTVDISLPATIMSSTIEQFGLFEMPYLVKDREHMKRIEAAVVWPDLAPLAEARGYRLLAVWENGFRHITNSRRPIVEPEDLRGIKLRTPRGIWRVKLFQALGANPTPMPYSEVFIALQTGVMDGQENPFTQIRGGRLHEVQEYLSLTGHVYSPAFVMVGAGRWDRLPEDIRETLAEIARDSQAFVYQAAERLDTELLQEMREAGIEVNEVDRDAFRRASDAVYEEFGATVEGGRELIEKANSVASG
jgi:tripartite ATP-independent transporter DctP family solute receptor